MPDYDVAIVGGGPAGAAAAIALARAGLRVLLADAGAARPVCKRGADMAGGRIGEGLPPSARPLLRELGVLDRVLADGHRQSHGTLAFWGAQAPHANDFMFQLHGHGLQLDRARFDASLRAHAHACGADVAYGAKLSLEAAATADAQHRLRLRGAERLRNIACSWLIDAGGRPAVLARRLGANRIRHDRLLAFYMRLGSGGGNGAASDACSDRDGRTFVEAVENGWWYSVLLPSCERLVVFLCDADLADRRALLARDGLWRALGSAPRLSALCREHGHAPVSAPHGADASSGQLDRVAGQGWLAVGDAALAFDPLSSKGISSALYTGLGAARTILACDGNDPAASERYADHLSGIHRVYREQLHAFYALETRWPHSPFWQRRNGIPQQSRPAMDGSLHAPQAFQPQPSGAIAGPIRASARNADATGTCLTPTRSSPAACR